MSSRISSLAHAEVLVRGETDEVSLFVDRAGNVSLDPPNAVADELETAGVFERFDGAHETHGTLAHQVRERNGAATVLDGDLQHETHVRGNKFLAGNLVTFLSFLEKNLLLVTGEGGGSSDVFKVTFEGGIGRVYVHFLSLPFKYRFFY